MEAKEMEKMHSDDRILVVRPIEGQKAKNSTGMVDSRLFSGDNTVHAMKDPITNLWMFKYDAGVLPGPLKQKFTGFKALMDHAHKYFNWRGCEIVEVIDNHAETA